MNFDDIRAQALGALDAFWESDESPAKPARKSAKKKRKAKRKPASKSVLPIVCEGEALPGVPAGEGLAFSDMSASIDAAMGGA